MNTTSTTQAPASPRGRYRWASLPTTCGDYAATRVCTDCGALVHDQTAHDRHHQRQEASDAR